MIKHTALHSASESRAVFSASKAHLNGQFREFAGGDLRLPEKMTNFAVAKRLGVSAAAQLINNQSETGKVIWQLK